MVEEISFRVKDLALSGRCPVVECGPFMEVHADGDIERIRLVVRRHRGVDLAHYRQAYVRRRIRARMRARGAAGSGDYARILARDEEEIGRLLGAISTKVTSFFRDPGLYTFLDARILPDILAAPRGRTVRFWSAGCATGEEAYSLAALVAPREPPRPVGHAHILGTDVDRTAIAAARRGEYPLSSLRRVPAEIQRRWFSVEREEGICRVSGDLKAYTTFRAESLLEPAPSGAFDLILCRNVFIYLEVPLQERILEQLARALRPGGYLALGRVERIAGPARASFEPVHVRERVYRRV